MSKASTDRSRQQSLALRPAATIPASAIIALLAAVSLLILAGASVASASGAAASRSASASSAGNLSYVPGQVLVKFNSGVSPARRSATKAVAGVDKTLARLGPEGRKSISLVQLEDGISVERAIARLRSSGAVSAAEPNYLRQTTAIPMPNDPFFANQWGLFNNGQLMNGVTGVVNADIQAEVAWDVSERGASNPVTVAVIDSGIDPDHPDLQGHLWQNPGEVAGDGLDNDANGYVDDASGYNMAGISQTYFNAIWTVGNTDTDWRAQSITGTGRQLTDVGLFVGTVGTPTAGIEVVVRDSLSGADLAAGTIAAGDVPAAGGVVNATLSPALTLADGATYNILFRATVADAANHYQVYGNAPTQPSYRADPYRGGSQHWWNGTAWAAVAANDWYFTTNANAVPKDDNGHGTHVSGIVAAGIDNGVGIAGVSYGARIMTIKASSSSGSFTSADIIESLNYAADNGAKIINMSFGGDTFSSLEQAAVLYAKGKGAALFAAAGNDGDNSHNFPASYNSVVSVAATTNRDTRAGFSNFNAGVDVSAPGDFVYSTMPTYPVALTSAGAAQDYAYLSGTSMASPLAAGLGAMALSRDPDLTAAEVMSVIETRLRDDLGPAGWDSSFGEGRITGVSLANEVPVRNNRIDGNWYIAPSPFGETLDSAGDRHDIFSVSVAAGQRVKVSMTAASGTEFDLRLYPPGTTDATLASGGAAAVAASAGGAYPEAFTYLAPANAGGTYYLQVNAKSGRGSYTIDYSVKDADDEIPGVPIPASPIAGSLQFFFDENDVYSVSLAAGEQLVASLSGQASGFDAFPLYLYAPGSNDFSNTPVAASAGGGDYPQALKYVVPAGAGGTYYLRAAFPAVALGGPYTLTYSVGPADVTPPVTTLSLSPGLPDGDNGWYTTPPSITLAANEAGVTYGQWDSTGSGSWWSYAGPFAAPEGDHTLHYYSVDEAGNPETVQDRAVKTDVERAVGAGCRHGHRRQLDRGHAVVGRLDRPRRWQRPVRLPRLRRRLRCRHGQPQRRHVADHRRHARRSERVLRDRRGHGRQ